MLLLLDRAWLRQGRAQVPFPCRGVGTHAILMDTGIGDHALDPPQNALCRLSLLIPEVIPLHDLEHRRGVDITHGHAADDWIDVWLWRLWPLTAGTGVV